MLNLPIYRYFENFSTDNVITGKALKQLDWGAVGRDVVEGIVSGMLDVDFDLDEFADNFADNWISGMKDIFGIHSPYGEKKIVIYLGQERFDDMVVSSIERTNANAGGRF